MKTRINIWFVATGICVILTLGAGALYVITRNISPIFLMLLFMGIGVITYYQGSKKIPSVPTVTAKSPTIGRVNCLAIYGRKKDGMNCAWKIQFEYREDEDEEELLKSDRWYFEDLHKWLPVIYADLVNSDGDWAVFELPDAKYTDPARMSLPLNRSAYKSWRTLEAGMFEKLKPLIMVGANTIVWFFLFLIIAS
jgi:hypothetical protein